MMHHLVFVLLSLAISSLSEALLTHGKSPKVCAPHVGCIEGIFMAGFQTERFEAFLGIPYALPPVEDLRLSSPKAHPRWSGVLNATEVKSDCIQKNYLLPNPQVYGSEDCLYLNVYRPNVRSKGQLPVMVYIHGGGWFSGSASPGLHGPEYLMDTQEVIVVTFGYRLGPLGFLSTDDINMSGNFGLKDQTLALRWIQKNIAAFGGNSKMVTVFGQSAGAISAHMHMLSRQSEGLFRSIITLSGTANVPFATTENPLEQTRKIAELCNVSDAQLLSTAKLARALRAVDAKTLVNAGDGLKYWDVDHLTNFRPVVEHAAVPDAFLTAHPKQLMAEAKYKPVPWLVGGVPQEGAVRVISILSNEQLRTNFNTQFDELLEKLMEFPSSFSDAEVKAKTQLLIREYFDGKHEINDATAQGFLDIITDRGFNQPLFNAIADYVHNVDTKSYPVYLYKFNYQGPYSFASIYNGGAQHSNNYGVVHCDDLIYLFRAPLLFPDFVKNSTDAAVVRTFVEYLVHFVKFGKPPNADNLQPCNASNFNSVADTICDYNEIVNVGSNSFQIKTENSFSVKRTLMWNDILKIAGKT